jgi:hypothetical protein
MTKMKYGLIQIHVYLCISSTLNTYSEYDGKNWPDSGHVKEA